MRSPRCLCSSAWQLYRASRMTCARVSCMLVVLVLCVVALAVTMVGCSPATGGVGVTARSTATSSAPVATATTEEHLAALARTAFGGSVQQSETTYDAQRQTVQVTGTLGGEVPIAAGDVTAAHERTKMLCFQVQRTLWASGVTLREVTVFVRGPTFDDYGDRYIDSYGTAILSTATAGTLAWNILSADSAWDRYDRVWLRPNYEPNWHYSAPPATTPTATSGSAG